MDELSKTISLDVVSKARPLAGLDAAQTKLMALQAALDGVQMRLNGLTSNAALKRSDGFLKDFVKGFQKGHPILDIGKQLGYDVKALEAQFQNAQHALESELTRLQNKLSKTPVKAKGGLHQQVKSELDAVKAELRKFNDTFVFDAKSKQYGVGSVSGAAKFFGDFQKSIIASRREPMEMLRTLFSSEVKQKSGNLKSEMGGPIALTISPSQIVASLAPGMIPLVISPGQIASAASGIPVGGNGHKEAQEAQKRGGVVSGVEGGSGSVIERRITEDLKGQMPTMMSEKERVGVGKTLTTISKVVDGIAEPLRTQSVESVAAELREKVSRRAAAARLELERAMEEKDPV